MFEYLCLACGEEFELGISSNEFVRCPECLIWRGVETRFASRILDMIFRKESIDEIYSVYS